MSKTSSSIDRVQAIMCGDLAEKLVQIDILEAGYLVHYSHRSSSHDCILEAPDLPLIAVQVKSTGTLTSDRPTYRFKIYDGKKRAYISTSFDLLALVAVDLKKVAYVATPSTIPSSVSIRPEDFDNYSLEAALDVLRAHYMKEQA